MSARPLAQQDINVIHSLDFKSYILPFDTENQQGKIVQWTKLAKRGTALSNIASVDNRRVGFSVWERGAKGKPAYILRFGVIPAYRRRGIARQIMGWVCDDLRAAKKKTVRTVLSQGTCLGANDPDDVSGFMTKIGFVWKDTIPKAFEEYGELVDGLVFERKL